MDKMFKTTNPELMRCATELYKEFYKYNNIHTIEKSQSFVDGEWCDNGNIRPLGYWSSMYNFLYLHDCIDDADKLRTFEAITSGKCDNTDELLCKAYDKMVDNAILYVNTHEDEEIPDWSALKD